MDDELHAVFVFASNRRLIVPSDRRPHEGLPHLRLEQAELGDRPRPRRRACGESRAEGVDRADAGPSIDRKIDSQCGTSFRAGFETSQAGRADAVAHLAGCTVGERDRHDLRQGLGGPFCRVRWGAR